MPWFNSPVRRSDLAGRSLGLGSCSVLTEGTRRAELAQLVPHHVLGHEDAVEHATVMYQEGVTHELRHHRARAGPRLDRFPPVHLVELLHLSVELLVDVRTFFQ